MSFELKKEWANKRGCNTINKKPIVASNLFLYKKSINRKQKKALIKKKKCVTKCLIKKILRLSLKPNAFSMINKGSSRATP